MASGRRTGLRCLSLPHWNSFSVLCLLINSVFLCYELFPEIFHNSFPLALKANSFKSSLKKKSIECIHWQLFCEGHFAFLRQRNVLRMPEEIQVVTSLWHSCIRAAWNHMQHFRWRLHMESQALCTYLFLWIRVVLYVAYWIKRGQFLNTVILLLFNAYGETDGQFKRKSAVCCVAVYQKQVCRNSFSF